ncbi:RyR domain-containing protein [Phocaeicola salanitronis]|uniref:RyR domain-containing protein n=1 Tax=Phocaeicola salanitronis TaxID=376805 RepID=UPI003207A162
MNGLPFLLVNDGEIENGIFDKNLSETFIATVSTSEKLDKIVISDSFRTWEERIGSLGSNLLSDNMSLVLYMAKKQYEKWCNDRINTGWFYGESVDMELKKHPCLTDFLCLPDAEKEFDLNPCRDVLKIIDIFMSKNDLSV